MIKSKLLEESGVKHAFYGTEYGFLDVLSDSELMSKFFDEIGAEELYIPMQVHSNKVASIYSRKTADAVVTNVKGIAIAVRTADCVPVLLYDKSSGIIGVIHAGWRGAMLGVVRNTCAAMAKLGADLKSTVAAIGPCVSAESYKLEDGFKKLFDDKFYINKDGSWFLDLRAAVVDQLKQNSISNVDESAAIDTVQNKDYYSYRRSESNLVNRNISYIML